MAGQITHILALFLLLLTSKASAQVLFSPYNNFQPISGQSVSIPIDISSLRNNRAFGLTPNESNFDGSYSAYPAQYIPPESFVYSGINYTFPAYKAAGNDNVISLGQIVTVPQAKYASVHMLASAESGLSEGYINATYADGSTSSGPVLVPAWWSWPYPTGGDLVFPYYLTNASADFNRSNIFQSVNWLDSSKELVSLFLPNVSSGQAGDVGGSSTANRLHIFSLSMSPVPVNASGPELEVQYARSTQKWMDGSSVDNKTQVFEVMVTNVGDEFVLRNHSVSVEIVGEGLSTAVPGTLKRLRQGDQAEVQVGVSITSNITAGSYGDATVRITGAGLTTTEYTFNATRGIARYEANYDSIYSHESPDWYNNAKYGIFIHWGAYSVPGWGNVGDRENYAEWYWWYLNQGPSAKTQTYQYHLETYGPDVVYDDFIANFTADAWDPKEWVDLFADAGATYFVQVSKHHEGLALFDLPANVSKRTTVELGPKRNLLKELFDASTEYQPQMHKAAYYSLPEWFHPDYARYGFGDWPGGLALNPYTNETEPYTGYVPVNDYVEDIIAPEMQTLADLGVEIMWCDIGGPNKTAEFAAKWFNDMADMNQQVVMNARCGLPGDFDTPEYARYPGVQVRKWETSQGMDPLSYGYNRATPAASYMNATTIVTSLVDIISKNGNFLLDVGPTANGTIIDVEQKNLREAGTWIKSHGEAIYNTTYWFVTPEEGDEIRFTTTPDAFYILTLAKPNSTVMLDSPVPWVPGDQVTVVGGNMTGAVVPSSMMANGSLVLDVSDEVAAADQYTWVFKITY